MTPDQAPSSCPFCGAGVLILSIGNPFKSLHGDHARFACGTHWFRCDEKPRQEQSEECATAERDRLTRERDDALTMLGVYKMDKDDLKARVKRLEEAGDAMAADDQCHPHLMDDWQKAKEAKP